MPAENAFAVQSPFRAFERGLALAEKFRLSREQAEQDDLAEKRQSLLDQAVERTRKPGASWEDFSFLASLLPPEQSTALRESYALRSKEAQEDSLSRSAEIFAALRGGKADLAVTLMDDIITAARGAGEEQRAVFIESLRDQVQSGDTDGPASVIGTLLAHMPRGDVVISKAMELEKRAAEVREEGVDLETKGVALEREKTNLASDVAVARIKGIEAQFASEKMKAELSLTQEQVQQSIAARKSHDAAALLSGAERAVKQKELADKSLGILTREQRFDMSQKTRKEMNDRLDIFGELKGFYGNLLTAQSGGVGDIAATNALSKMFDTRSAVLQGEQAAMKKADSVAFGFMAFAREGLGAGPFSDEKRARMLSQGRAYYQIAVARERAIKDGILRQARSYGLRDEDILYSLTYDAIAPNAKTYPFATREAADKFDAEIANGNKDYDALATSLGVRSKSDDADGTAVVTPEKERPAESGGAEKQEPQFSLTVPDGRTFTTTRNGIESFLREYGVKK